VHKKNKPTRKNKHTQEKQISNKERKIRKSADPPSVSIED